MIEDRYSVCTYSKYEAWSMYIHIYLWLSRELDRSLWSEPRQGGFREAQRPQCVCVLAPAENKRWENERCRICILHAVELVDTGKFVDDHNHALGGGSSIFPMSAALLI